MHLTLLFLFISSQVLAQSELETAMQKGDELFFTFPRVQQLTQLLKSQAVLSSTAIQDRGLNITSTISQTKSPELGQRDLLASGGVYRTTQDSLNSSLTFGVRNQGVFNSTQLQVRGSWFDNDFQKYLNSVSTIDSTRSYSLNLSYDIVRGGYSDPVLLSNKSTERSQYSNLIQTTVQLQQAFLDFRFLILDIYSSYCKLKTSQEDMEVFQKVMKEVKLGHELKSTNYKQYLNVVDTFNFIRRNNLSFELGFESNLQRFGFWSNEPTEFWKEKLVRSITCPKTSGEFSSYVSKTKIVYPAFPETMSAIQAKSSAEAAQYAYLLAKQQIKPSVRPFVELTRQNSTGIETDSLAVGVTLNWDTPSIKNEGQVSGAFLQAGSSAKAVEASERDFVSQINTFKVNMNKNKELLSLSIESLENSNNLIQLLEVQKSIGQVDSVSLSNAYTQRNQILTTIFDSMVNLEKTAQQIYYLKHWKELLKRAGIDLR